MLGAYCVSKTALLGLNQVAAATLAPEGIRVNCIGPGIIKTKLSKMVMYFYIFLLLSDYIINNI